MLIALVRIVIFFQKHSWPTTSAVIEKTYIDLQGTSTSGGRSGGLSYHAVIVYRFQVGSKSFQKREEIQILGFEGTARKFIEAVRARPVVHYHPNQPWRNTIDRGLPMIQFACLAGGLLFIAAGRRYYTYGQRAGKNRFSPIQSVRALNQAAVSAKP